MFDSVNKNVQLHTDYILNIHSAFADLQHKKTDVLLQCTDIDIMMYRNGTLHVPKSYYKNTCTEIDLICTEVVMYRLPKVYTPFPFGGGFTLGVQAFEAWLYTFMSH